MEESSDWLDTLPHDNTAMAEVKKSVEKWRELKFKMDAAESVFTEAKRKYDDYIKELSVHFRQNGLEALRLEDGSVLEVVEKVRCSIQQGHKNEVADWLRSRGAERLVKSQLIVMPSAKALLDREGVGYDEEVSMNTNSVKAWVRGEMDMQNLRAEDLPKGLSWFMYDDVVVTE